MKLCQVAFAAGVCFPLLFGRAEDTNPSLGSSTEPPRIHLLATGGTIAGGSRGSLKADELTQLIPELNQIARLSQEDFTRIGSSRMTPEIQFRLARRINELFASGGDLAGIVVTHGTDSLEETAFFLDLGATRDADELQSYFRRLAGELPAPSPP